MKDHGEIGHLTKFDTFRINRNEFMHHETWFKIHTNISQARPGGVVEYQYTSFLPPGIPIYLKNAKTLITNT